MKRKIFILLITILCLIQNTVLGEELKYDSIKTFSITDITYSDFLEEPTAEKITNKKMYTIEKIKSSDNDEVLYNKSFYRDGRWCNSTTPDYLSYLSTIPVSYHLFELMNDTNLMENIFSEADIKCDVLKMTSFYVGKGLYYKDDDIDFVNSISIPLTLYVETNIGKYCVIFKESRKTPDNIPIVKSGDYNVIIYTFEQYKERFSLHDGEIMINGEVVEDKHFKIGYDDCQIPLRFVMEYLGFQVDWIDETRSVKISNAQKELIIDLAYNHYFVAYDIHDGRIVVYSTEIKEILKYFETNVNMKMDYDNYTLSITTNI